VTPAAAHRLPISLLRWRRRCGGVCGFVFAAS